MFDIEIFRKKSLLRDISTLIQFLITICRHLFIKPVFYNIIPAWIGNTEFLLQFLTDSVIFFRCCRDIRCRLFSFLLALFQFPCKFNPALIRLAILINHCIHYIDHLVKDFLDNRIPEAVSQHRIESALIRLVFNLFFCQ